VPPHETRRAARLDGARRPRRPRQGDDHLLGEVADFGAWAEQLIAESTGKDGKGLIPIDGEPLGDPSLYGNDRFFIDIRTEGEDDARMTTGSRR
jgi:hypothetical protein